MALRPSNIQPYGFMPPVGRRHEAGPSFRRGGSPAQLSDRVDRLRREACSPPRRRRGAVDRESLFQVMWGGAAARFLAVGLVIRDMSDGVHRSNGDAGEPSCLTVSSCCRRRRLHFVLDARGSTPPSLRSGRRHRRCRCHLSCRQERTLAGSTSLLLRGDGMTIGQLEDVAAANITNKIGRGEL